MSGATPNTALHEAAFRGTLELVQLLRAHGADATLRNDEGRTHGHATVARRLRGELT